MAKTINYKLQVTWYQVLLHICIMNTWIWLKWLRMECNGKIYVLLRNPEFMSRPTVVTARNEYDISSFVSEPGTRTGLLSTCLLLMDRETQTKRDKGHNLTCLSSSFVTSNSSCSFTPPPPWNLGKGWAEVKADKARLTSVHSSPLTCGKGLALFKVSQATHYKTLLL
jgi:hypothetical protein